jgi:hypothetical protein
MIFVRGVMMWDAAAIMAQPQAAVLLSIRCCRVTQLKVYSVVVA